LEELGNPLLPTLNIEAKEASQYDVIVNFLEQGKYKQVINKINYKQSKPLTEKLSKFSKNTQRTGAIVSVVLIIVAGLVTFNTICLAMYNFRDEIAVMRLVGAGDWYIRDPFIVEGIMYGIIAAVATLIFCFPLLYFSLSKITI